MTTAGWFETNVRRVLKARARAAGAAALPNAALRATLGLCLATLRPRNRWPENTRVYAAIRARLTENPVRALLAFGAAVATLFYLGFGQRGLIWLGSLLAGTG